MLGYSVYGHDNDTYFFRERNDVKRCPACGHLLDKWKERLGNASLSKKSLEVSYSYDGVLVVNERFMDVVHKEGLAGLSFIPINDGFFHIRPKEEVKFDAEKRKTRFINQCPMCGNFESIVGSSPVLLVANAIPENGFVRTDIEFGSLDEKHPLVLCGLHAGHVLKANKFAGLVMNAIA
ncbi:MAG: hypothetical protein J6333_00325 [Planctomycetes bacterium]|nr:hypothetical protein [Planctomycetota bacterium]